MDTQDIPDPGVDHGDDTKHHAAQPGSQAPSGEDRENRTSCGGHADQPLQAENGCDGPEREREHTVTWMFDRESFFSDLAS